MEKMTDEKALEIINERMASGEAERGEAVLERLIRLSVVTDAQQLFAYRSETFTPQDARDFITALAAHGMHVVATMPDAPPPPDAVAKLGRM